MPERLDKNGPPELAVQIVCRHPDCGHKKVLTGGDADRMAEKLWAHSRRAGKLHLRELIANVACAKCYRRFTSLHFKLVYHGVNMRPRQHHDSAQPIPPVT